MIDNNAKVEWLKKKFANGTRIELIDMGSDPHPIAAGSRGTVIGVDDMGDIIVDWDNGRGLNLIYGKDKFKKINNEDPSLQEKIDTYLDEKKLQEGR